MLIILLISVITVMDILSRAPLEEQGISFPQIDSAQAEAEAQGILTQKPSMRQLAEDYLRLVLQNPSLAMILGFGIFGEAVDPVIGAIQNQLPEYEAGGAALAGALALCIVFCHRATERAAHKAGEKATQMITEFYLPNQKQENGTGIPEETFSFIISYAFSEENTKGKGISDKDFHALQTSLQYIENIERLLQEKDADHKNTKQIYNEIEDNEEELTRLVEGMQTSTKAYFFKSMKEITQSVLLGSGSRSSDKKAERIGKSDSQFHYRVPGTPSIRRHALHH